MKRIFLLVCAAVMLAACVTKKPNEEAAIRLMCEEIAGNTKLQEAYELGKNI